ncbi:P-loop containing nucleoside triphosphate hydrolase protein [Fimicolochytrium jonesii]|uniref:P-loop containing nucleoside triphosphate hydrolase protein n=1 Tax=Fimicolochytrium jonesii TaxID=1396493 RepID=UPI0022FF19A6|nr:P-loop containing nucleoside triphosphate hydrolase protein [Fimicolochytrium jonesii]KAI8817619.1 P-loop containing nucleoside triphosphate hydrolase protein [Fimicolochytrium jonesii]
MSPITKVYLNVRKTGEGASPLKCGLDAEAQSIHVVLPGLMASQKSYHFDGMFDPQQPPKEAARVVVKDLLAKCLKGYNTTLYHFGRQVDRDVLTSSTGIVQLFIKHVVQYLEATSDPYEPSTCHVQLVEVVGELIRDLLKNGHDSVAVKHDDHGWLEPEDGTYLDVREEWSCLERILKATSAVAILNQSASDAPERLSVLVYTFKFRLSPSRRQTSGSDSSAETLYAKCRIVDVLCEPELFADNPDQLALQYGAYQSGPLSLLWNAIKACSMNEREHLDFGTCVATQFLKDDLGGNAYPAFMFSADLSQPAKSLMRVLETSKLVRKFRACPVQNTEHFLELQRRANALRNKSKGADEDAHSSGNDLLNISKLKSMLEYLHRRTTTLETIKAELQSKLRQSEEERLTLRKEILDVKIEASEAFRAVGEQKESEESRSDNLREASDALRQARAEKAEVQSDLREALAALSNKKSVKSWSATCEQIEMPAGSCSRTKTK